VTTSGLGMSPILRAFQQQEDRLMPLAYEEIVDFIAAEVTPHNLIDFRPS
jgi:hypothetical protein